MSARPHPPVAAVIASHGKLERLVADVDDQRLAEASAQ